jgi:hypothetical protein
MEGMDANTKGNLFHEHKSWKCPHQSELLDEHSSTWATNGLISLHYKGYEMGETMCFNCMQIFEFLILPYKKKIELQLRGVSSTALLLFLFRAFEYLVYFDISFIRAFLSRNANKRSYLISLI